VYVSAGGSVALNSEQLPIGDTGNGRRSPFMQSTVSRVHDSFNEAASERFPRTKKRAANSRRSHLPFHRANRRWKAKAENLREQSDRLGQEVVGAIWTTIGEEARNEVHG